MSPKPVKVTIDQRGLDAKLRKTLSGRLDRRTKGYRQLAKVADEIVDEAKLLARTRLTQGNVTGNYVRNIVTTVSVNGTPSASAVARNPISGRAYSADIEYGTANNGQGYIYPTQSKVLVVPTGGKAKYGRSRKIRGGGEIIETPPFLFPRRVRGQKAKHIMRDAALKVANRYGLRVNKLP